MAASANAVADRAIKLAQAFLNAHQGELATLAGHDRETMMTAQRIVVSMRETAPEIPWTVSHIAYAVLAAARGDLLSG